eukprot:TRINITY_DN2071_c0_g1_i1.p1 TRINITY_DN2071_c0_g1~~TRINITY_DN2071_c0_g1_i1.p1  ORF type:complete len:414 (+),score=49.07 TRINITY_DN2071_c0_g1_i1:113-1354(+)
MELSSTPYNIFKSAKLQAYLAKKNPEDQDDLDLTSQEIPELSPAFFDSLPSENLQWLRLFYNSLTTIPPEISHLKNLKGLYIQTNSISTLPWTVLAKDMPNLQFLKLVDNNISSIPPLIALAGPGTVLFPELVDLNLSQNKLSSLDQLFPPGSFPNLTTLSISFNRLTSIPSDISNLKSLTSLQIDKNRLTSVPFSLGFMTNLTSLSFDKNKIATLPSSVRFLTNLTKLSIHNNEKHLQSLPAALLVLMTQHKLTQFIFSPSYILSKCLEICTIHQDPSLQDLVSSVVINAAIDNKISSLGVKGVRVWSFTKLTPEGQLPPNSTVQERIELMDICSDVKEKLVDETQWKVCAGCAKLYMGKEKIRKVWRMKVTKLPHGRIGNFTNAAADVTWVALFCSKQCYHYGPLASTYST